VTLTDHDRPASTPRSGAFLEVRDLRVHFPTDDGLVKSVDGLSFGIDRGKTLGIVGESGSGKSVTSMSVMGLHKKGTAKISGEILLDGKDLISSTPEEVRKMRGKRMAMIFQDPLSAMHPYYTTSRPRRPARTRSRCSTGSASPSRTAASTPTRTSTPAACGSAR